MELLQRCVKFQTKGEELFLLDRTIRHFSIFFYLSINVLFFYFMNL